MSRSKHSVITILDLPLNNERKRTASLLGLLHRIHGCLHLQGPPETDRLAALEAWCLERDRVESRDQKIEVTAPLQAPQEEPADDPDETE